MLLISHDFNYIEQVCENIAILNNKSVVENTSIERLLKKFINIVTLCELW